MPNLPGRHSKQKRPFCTWFELGTIASVWQPGCARFPGSKALLKDEAFIDVLARTAQGG